MSIPPPTQPASGPQRRARLARARLMLIFTPGQPGADLERVSQLLPEVDVVQLRVKHPLQTFGPSPAAELFAMALELLERIELLPASARPLFLVNDRPDVARALGERCDGVHLGQEDAPATAMRAFLGPEALIGFSTHSLGQVARAQSLPVDYLGFGPVFASKTKGYAEGLGAERASVAASGSAVPVFAIGGIDLASANELAPLGRAAVGAALLEADDPARAARTLAAALRGE